MGAAIASIAASALPASGPNFVKWLRSRKIILAHLSVAIEAAETFRPKIDGKRISCGNCGGSGFESCCDGACGLADELANAPLVSSEGSAER